MRFGAASFLILALAGCSSLVGVDGDDDDTKTPSGDDDDATGDDDEASSSSSGTAGRPDASTSSSGSSGSSSGGSSSGGPDDAGPDAAPPLCPSDAAACQPETVIAHLRSPGELSAVGTKLVFREHAKGAGSSYSVLRFYDPALDCHDASCLVTLDTDKNTYRPSAGNESHLCYTLQTSIVCRDPSNLDAAPRVLAGDEWWYQAGFVSDNTLIYGSPQSGGRSNLAAIDLSGTELDPYTIIELALSPIEYVAVQPNPAAQWFAWLQGDGRLLASATVGDDPAADMTYEGEVVSIAAAGNSLVWATADALAYSPYGTGGAGTSLTGPSFSDCGPTGRAYRSIAGGQNEIVAVERCAIPGALGSALVLYPLNGAPVLLDTAANAISSAVFIGDYVYYAISKIGALISEDTTEEIRRIRIR